MTYIDYRNFVAFMSEEKPFNANSIASWSKEIAFRYNIDIAYAVKFARCFYEQGSFNEVVQNMVRDYFENRDFIL